MKPFIYEQSATRVVFGPGGVERVPEELERLGGRRALVIASPGRRAYADDALRRLGAESAGCFIEPAAHVPIEAARAAWEMARSRAADSVVVIGGGSAIGLAKGVALETGAPILALPTTYSGSEATSIYGFTEGGVKRTGRDPRVLPRTVLYDPTLARSLPPEISGPSGVNALAHCVVGLYAPDATPVSTMFAAEGIRALSAAIPAVVERPGDLEARTRAFYGSWLAGTMLRMVGVSLHYKLCHVLGGSFGLGHAEAHTVMLPHVVAFNREAAPEALRIAADALGADDAARGIFDLVRRIGAPFALESIGMPWDGLDRAVALTLEDPPFNPRPFDARSIRVLLEGAYEGALPGSE